MLFLVLGADYRVIVNAHVASYSLPHHLDQGLTRTIGAAMDDLRSDTSSVSEWSIYEPDHGC